MNAEELQDYIHEHIPLSRAMEVTVVSLDDDSVILRAPLGPNINHRQTLFGGSASAISLLAGWSLVHTRLGREGMERHIVVRRNTMSYELPVDDTFTARSYLEKPSEWQTFLDRLDDRGMARVSVIVDLECQGRRAGNLSGEFVALSQAMLKSWPNLNTLKR